MAPLRVLNSPAAPPWLPAGTVYGTLLNFRREWDRWAPRMTQAPYQQPPQAPVLYVKTANTFAAQHARVPTDAPLEVGATVGLIVGDAEQNAIRAGVRSCISATDSGAKEPSVAALVLLSDLSLPHASLYRPPLRFRNRDGFLVCGPAAAPAAGLDVDALRIELCINDALVQTVDLSTLVRDTRSLLAEVATFMALRPGDVLMPGTDCLADGSRPRAGPGDRVTIRAPGLATLVHDVTGLDA